MADEKSKSSKLQEGIEKYLTGQPAKDQPSLKELQGFIRELGKEKNLREEINKLTAEQLLNLQKISAVVSEKTSTANAKSKAIANDILKITGSSYLLEVKRAEIIKRITEHGVKGTEQLKKQYEQIIKNNEALLKSGKLTDKEKERAKENVETAKSKLGIVKDLERPGEKISKFFADFGSSLGKGAVLAKTSNLEGIMGTAASAGPQAAIAALLIGSMIRKIEGVTNAYAALAKQAVMSGESSETAHIRASSSAHRLNESVQHISNSFVMARDEVYNFLKGVMGIDLSTVSTETEKVLVGFHKAFGLSAQQITQFGRQIKDINIPVGDLGEGLQMVFSGGSKIASRLGLDINEVTSTIVNMGVALRQYRVGFEDVLKLTDMYTEQLGVGDSALKRMGYTSKDVGEVVSDMAGMVGKMGPGVSAMLGMRMGISKTPLEAMYGLKYGMGAAGAKELGGAKTMEGISAAFKTYAKSVDISGAIGEVTRSVDQFTSGMSGASKAFAAQSMLQQIYGVNERTAMYMMTQYDVLSKLGPENKAEQDKVKEELRKMADPQKYSADSLQKISFDVTSMDDHIKVLQQTIMDLLGNLLMGVLTKILEAVATIGSAITFGRSDFFNQLKERLGGVSEDYFEGAKVAFGDLYKGVLGVAGKVGSGLGISGTSSIEKLIGEKKEEKRIPGIKESGFFSNFIKASAEQQKFYKETKEKSMELLYRGLKSKEIESREVAPTASVKTGHGGSFTINIDAGLKPDTQEVLSKAIVSGYKVYGEQLVKDFNNTILKKQGH